MIHRTLKTGTLEKLDYSMPGIKHAAVQLQFLKMSAM